MKYIIVEEESGLEVAILFHELIKHELVAHGWNKVVSAGFCRVVNSSIVVYGKSTSLKLKPRTKDLDIIGEAMNWELP